MEYKNAAFYVQMEPSKMRRGKSHANHAQDQKILGPWRLQKLGMHLNVEVCANLVNIPRMALHPASSVPWAHSSLKLAVLPAFPVEEASSPNTWEPLPSRTVKPEFNVHLDISTTPPLTDVFAAQQEHTSQNLERIIVFPAQEIPRLTLMAPQT